MEHSRIYLAVFMLFLLAGCGGGSDGVQPPGTTAPKDWSTPEAFYQSGGYSTAKMDNQGNIIIVTWHFNNTNSHYELIRHEYRNNAWSGPELISDVPGQPYNPAYSPVIAMDNNGNAIIVWYQTGDAALMITEYRNGAWSTPRALSALNNVSGGHSVAMNDLGDAVIVWETSSTIYKAESANGVWSSPVQLSGTNTAEHPKVRINGNGDGVIIWVDSLSNTIVKTELTQGAWSAPETIGTTSGIATPDLEMDGSGNAIVVWEKDIGAGVYQIYKNELRNQVWSGPQSVSEDGVRTYNPDLAMSANGNAVITWQQLSNSVYQIYRTDYMNGQWDAPTPVSLAGINAINPRVEMNTNGDAILVWNEENGTSWQVMMSQLISGSWTDGGYFTISDNRLNPVNYDIDMNGGGDAIFVWGQSDSGTWFEYRSRYH